MSPSCDVLIVGGGLVGCAAAWMLAGEGLRVRLIERDQVNQHASGQNAGSLHLQLEYRLVAQGPEQARKAAEALPMHLYSAKVWRKINSDLGPAIGLVQHGGLMVAETPEQVRLLEQKSALERSWGMPVDVIAGEDLRAVAPYLSAQVIAASRCPLEGKVNARSAAPTIASAAAERGADIRTRAELVALERVGTRWRARVQYPGASETGRGGGSDSIETIDAETVIVAAGVWTAEVLAQLGVRLPTLPVALMMTVTLRRPAFLAHLVQHAGQRLSLKQTVEGNVLIGGGWPARFARREDGAVDLTTRPEVIGAALAGNVQVATRVVPALAGTPALRSWVGTTSITPDQLPLVGAVPGRPGLFVATSGAIFTLGPGLARALSDVICGRVPGLDLSCYSLSRFGAAA